MSWSRAQQEEALHKVVERVKVLTAQGQSSSVIFDLDGTLYDNRPRTAFILREIAEQFCDKIPGLSRIADQFTNLNLMEYSLHKTLKNFGIEHELEIDFIQKEWEKRFFSDDHQQFDVPLPGAKQYVDLVHQAGGTIIYLTGRDMKRMLVGTTVSLRQYGLPVGIVGTMIIQKQDLSESDESFKVSTVDYIRRLGSVVGIFENEPANINLLKNHFPESECFFVRTQHRDDAPEIRVSAEDIVDFRC